LIKRLSLNLDLFKRINTNLFVLVFACLATNFLTTTQAYSQCGTGSTVYTVNLTGDPNGDYISSAVKRDGPDNCIVFNLTLDPSASGILFSIFSGAEPSGSLTYQINCGPTQTVGQPICLTGTGPFILTFCKPGGNINQYKISSIGGVVAGSNSSLTNNNNTLLCQGGTLNLTASTILNATYSWTGPNGFTSNLQNPSIPNVSLAAAGTYTVQVTQTGGCASPLGTTIVAIKPIPPTPTASVNGPICVGETLLLTSSTLLGATYIWSGPNGFTSNLQNPTIPNTIIAASGNYFVSTVLNGCPSNAAMVTATVNPIPVATATPNIQSLCSGEVSLINLASNIPGTTFSWTVISSGVSGATAGSGSTINQQLTATGTSSGTATYNITPLANGCTGTPITVTLTVNPRPVINPATLNAQTICSGSSFSIPLTSNISGTTFSWTVVQSGVTGAILGSGNEINQSLSTTAQAIGTATYTVIPRLNGCDGTSFNIVITVNPLPIVNAIADINVCANSNISAQILSSLPAGSTFTWTNSNTAIGLVANGTGNVPSFTALNTTSSNLSATVSITPTLNNCIGPVSSYTITVRPLPVITGPSNIAVCSESVVPTVTFSSVSSGATLIWTNSNTGIGLAANGTGNVPSFTATNTTLFPIVSIITVTPSLNGCVGPYVTYSVTVNPIPTTPLVASNGPLCLGETLNLTANSLTGASYNWTGPNGFTSNLQNPSVGNVTNLTSGDYFVTATLNNCTSIEGFVSVVVNPIPVATATPTIQSLCSGEVSSINLASNIAGTTFSWTVISSGVSGATAGSGGTINQQLTATGTSSGTATYNITPLANGCAGTPIKVTLSVNPRPVINPATSNAQTICSGSSFSIPLTSNILGTTFSWTVVQSGVLGAISGSGNEINQSLSTTAQAIGTATYTVIPRLNGCDGTSFNIVITVNPLPIVNAIADINVCANSNISAQILSSLPAGSTFTWTNSNTAIGLVANGTGNVPSFTALNTTSSNLSATVSITPTLNNCIGPVSSYTITVRPLPVITGPSNIAVCSESVVPTVTFSSVSSGATLIWTNSNTGIGLAANGTGNVPSFTATNTTLFPIVSIITVTPSLNGCVGPYVTYSVTVNPKASIVSALATPVSSCAVNNGSITIIAGGDLPLSYSIDGGNTFQSSGTFIGLASGSYFVAVRNGFGCITFGNISFVGNPSPPSAPTIVSNSPVCEGSTIILNIENPNPLFSYNWIGPNGFTATGSNVSRPNTTLAMAGNYAVSATFNGCVSNSTSTIIVINALPLASEPSSSVFCNGVVVPATILTSTPNGASFIWTNSNTSIGLASTGIGDVPSFTITNNGAIPVTATITVTPTLNGCVGTSSSYTITVNPLPVVTATPSSQTVCSGTAPLIQLSSNISGTTYRWTVVQTGVSGATAGTGSVINQTITAVSGTAVYTIIPTANGCDGASINVTITVNPVPVAQTPVPDNQSICSGSTTNIPLSSSVSGTNFTWTVVQTGVSGAIIGSGTIISQTLLATGTIEGTAVYTITPTASGCVGIPMVLRVRVKPLPTVIVPSSFAVCAGSLVPASNFTSEPTGATYDWTSTNASVGLVISGGGNVPSFFTVNNGSTAISTIITVTPTLNGCVGPSASYRITVNPLPSVVEIADRSVCVGSTVPQVIIQSTPIGATYSWTNSNPSIGLQASGTGNIPSFTATNTTNGAITAVITITSVINGCLGLSSNYVITVKSLPVINLTPSAPRICFGSEVIISASGAQSYVWSPLTNLTFIDGGTVRASPATTTTYTVTGTDANGCSSSKNVTITVNPLPVVTATPSSQTVCSGTAPLIQLSSNISGTTYRWTVVQTGVSGATAGTGSVINQTITAVSGTAVYTIIPTANGCDGASINVTITVNPVPVAQTPVPDNQSICSGSTTNIPLSSSVSGTNFTWTVVQTGVSGAIIGSGTIISQTLLATGTIEGTAVYTITPTASGCVGIPMVLRVRVKPLPTVIVPSSFAVCAGSLVPASNFTSEPTGATYDWTSTNASVGLVISGGGNVPSFFTVNNGSTAISTIITVTPTLNGCVGPSASYRITVNPLPSVVEIADRSVCVGSTVPQVIIQSTPIGATYSWTNSNPSIGLQASGTGNIPSFTATNTTNGAITAVITITSVINGCLGLSSNYVITVKSLPVINLTPSAPRICFGSEVIISASGAQSYVWSPLTNLTFIDGGTVRASPATTTTYTVTGTDANGCSSSKNVTISVSLPLKITNSVESITCKGSNDGRFIVGITGGNAPYNIYYINSSGLFSSPISANVGFNPVSDVPVGSYTIRVIDRLGCLQEINANVTEPSEITATHTSINSVCKNSPDGSATVTPSGGNAPYRYQWVNQNGTSATLSNVPSGNYTIIITDAKNCTFNYNVFIIGGNCAPIAMDDNFIAFEDTPLTKNVSVNDSDTDGDSLRFFLLTNPANGSIIFNLDGSFTFTPNPNWNGVTTFVYRACDPAGLCSIAKVTITVNPTNDPPIAQDDSFTVPEDTQLNGTVITNDSDIDGDLLIYDNVTEPANGTLVFNADGTFVFTPNKDWNGTTSFEYVVCDPAGLCDRAIVTITISPTNDPPVAEDDSFFVLKNITFSETVILNDSDIDGDILSFSRVSNPSNGILTLNINGTFTYTPNLNFTGIDSFVYRACDPFGLCDNATVTIMVQPQVIVNLTPIQAIISEGERIKVTATLTEPLLENVFVTLKYSGNAIRGVDYDLTGSFITIRFLAGETTSSDSLTLIAKNDVLKEPQENALISVERTSSIFVLIGTPSNIAINDIYPDAVPFLPSENPDINPDPLTSPNGDGEGNEAFIIYNIAKYPNNEVIIFNRLGNAVFQIKNYDNNDNAFKGIANTGLLLINPNKELVDGVYYYLIHTTYNGEKKLNKGYLILKR
jgi:hypothetical protein